jgi:hypothetical protein
VAGARFLLTQGPVFRNEPDALPPGRRGLTGLAPELPADSRVWTGWLLLGGNNRELGRGCVLFHDPTECETAIAALVGAAEALRTTITADLDVSSWRWRAEDDSGPVAVGGRLYQRRRECAYALNQFLAALPQAELPAGPARLLTLSWTDWSRPGEAALRRQASRGAAPDRAAPAPLRPLGC